jgi:thiamine biosynthesis protein ThiI
VTSVVLHYKELVLKGKNRPWFIHALLRNIRHVLADLDVFQVSTVAGRIEIQFRSDDHWAVARVRLARLPGIANFARAVRVPADVDAMAEAILAGLRGQPPRPFRIRARRAEKRFSIPSPELERLIGARVHTELGWPVDLSDPEVTIRIEILPGEALIILDRENGAGGLPVGTGGKAVCLLSGGIDSPVAAWRIIRRGVKVQLVHFHSYPILDETSQEKVRTLAAILSRHQLKSRLYLVPFGAVQQQVMVQVPTELRIIVYRRLMLRIAQRIAERVHANALITGDVVGQVASQTIENMQAIDDAATMLVLRPLVGFDKEEITNEAIRLGTYATSILPDQDCCTLFTPQNPATRAHLDEVRAAEALLDVEALIGQALRETAVEERLFPPRQRADATYDGEPDRVENDKMRRSLAQETRP